jgi:exopolysaccharide biosynthesis polyprenyl glycosylphosphotransferase
MPETISHEIDTFDREAGTALTRIRTRKTKKSMWRHPIETISKRYGGRKLLWLMSDIACFALAGGIALGLKASGTFDVFYRSATMEKILTFAITAFLTICSFRYYNLYKQRVINSRVHQIKLLAKNAMITFVILLILAFLIKPQDAMNDSRTQVLSFVILAYAFIVFNRLFLVYNFRVQLHRANLLNRNVLAIGAGEIGANFANVLKLHRELGIRLVGFIDDDRGLLHSRVDGAYVLGTTDDLERIIEERDVDEIFVTINAIDHEKMLDLLHKCRGAGCQVNLVSRHFGIITKKVGTTEFKDLRYVPIYQSWSNSYREIFKRIVDIVGALLLLCVLAPFFIIIGLLIKLTSKGSVFYTPRSIGKGGQPFKFYKFRSMYHNAPHDVHKNFIKDFVKGRAAEAKLQHDDRITFIGRFLRRYSLDEFPQLFNVIKGNMSLVGPRPSTQYEYEMMEEWHRRRFQVLPGMTGLWQVSGRSEVSYLDMIMMDLYYVENCSFWQDVVILLKTVEVVVKGKGGV